MTIEYQIKVILAPGHDLGTFRAPQSLPAAKKLASELSCNSGVKRAIVIEILTSPLYGYKDGNLEIPHGD